MIDVKTLKYSRATKEANTFCLWVRNINYGACFTLSLCALFFVPDIEDYCNSVLQKTIFNSSQPHVLGYTILVVLYFCTGKRLHNLFPIFILHFWFCNCDNKIVYISLLVQYLLLNENNAVNVWILNMPFLWTEKY